MSRTELLISVRSAEEAAAMVEVADWIDLKEPLNGPLGAVDATTAADVCDALDGRRRVTAAGGELLDWDAAASQRLLDIDAIGVVKLGLAGCATRSDWRQIWNAAHRQVARCGKQLAAVAYADYAAANAPQPADVVDLAIKSGCHFLLVDTWEKSSGRFVDFLETVELRPTFFRARASGITTVAAGSIGMADLKRLPWESIDVVAVRGAVCWPRRTDAVCQDRAIRFRRAMVQTALVRCTPTRLR